MIIVPIFLIVNIFSTVELSEIYQGKSFPWVVYYDDTKENIIIEIGGSKFGEYDYLRKSVTGSDTIAYSKVGKLYRKSNNLYYCNDKLKLNIKLEKKSYSSKIDMARYKIYNVKSFAEISHLKDSLKIADYKYDWSVKDDYEFFRDNSSIPKNYVPNYRRRLDDFINRK